MKFNRLFLVSVMVLTIILMGSVSAEDNATSDLTVGDDLQPTIELNSNDYESNLGETNLNELKILVNSTEENGEIRLTNDYAFDENTDSDIYGIKIVDAMTIDGQGHSIDADNRQIFEIRGSNVTLKNIRFKNTGIVSRGNCSYVVNCSFENCSGNNFGGAIMSYGDNLNVADCSFKNCFCNLWCAYGYSEMGCAIYVGGDNSIVAGCSFLNCSLVRSDKYYDVITHELGEAIYSEGVNCSVVGCSFRDLQGKYVTTLHFKNEFILVNSSFVNDLWYGEKSGSVSNVSINGIEYDISIFENLKGNEKILLTRDYVLVPVIEIAEDNVVIDGGGNSIIGNKLHITGENVTVMNCRFVSSGITLNASDCTIVNCSFVDCYYDCYGGAIYSYGVNCTVVNCSFADCTAKYYAGAIYSAGSDFKVAGCSFVNCSCYETGAVYSCGANFSVYDCTFLDCLGRFGGAIYSHQYDVDIFGCDFINCSDIDWGDAIYFGSGFNLANSSFVNCGWYSEKSGKVSNVLVDGVECGSSVFDDIKDNDRIVLTRDCAIFSAVPIDADNVVIDGGGNSITGNRIFSVSGNNVTIMNCNFINCSLKVSDVVVLVKTGANCRIVNCSFVNCSSMDSYSSPDGLNGVIYLNYGARDCDVVNCSFKRCSADFGGAIQFYGDGCSVVGCSFMECSSLDGGGAILIVGNNSLIVNSTFVNCFANSGGGIDASYGDCSIVGCSFMDCSASNFGAALNVLNEMLFVAESSFVNCSSTQGGAIFAQDSSLKGIHDGYCSIVDSRFRDCHSGYGGAVCSGNSSLVGCDFVNCRAYSDVEVNCGGAISCYGHLHTVGCSFSDCSGVCGGAIYSCGDDCIITASKFLNCSADFYIYYYDEAGYGGAVYAENSTVCTIADCSFINSTSRKDGVIYSKNPESTVVNSTFVNCFMDPKITASELKMYYGDGSYFTVNVFDIDAKAAVGVPVVFKIDGKKFKTVKTDENGNAKVKITSLPGNYKISATALDLTVTEKLTVKKVLSLKNVKVKKSAKKLVLTASLKKVNGKYLKNKKITFKFNGKKYITKTNKKGVAKATVKSKDLKKLKVGKKVTYQATYLKCTVKKSVKIKK